MSQSRQLAAIMFTDIVGYTALMGKDEQKAFSILEKNRQIQKPVMEHHRGRWLKEIGDGVLASFETVSDAVYAAIEIQEACSKEEDLTLRIGIHLGEVVFNGADVFGDGVNIASRLESVASIISFQKNTNTVASVISAESIRRSPDKKTGEVLKRTPGTSIQEGKYLIVRGLADRYNQAMLNGILLSSTEPDRKTFSFDIFPERSLARTQNGELRRKVHVVNVVQRHHTVFLDTILVDH